MAATTDLERYREISRLGSGGMSTVMLAEDTLLGRRVALKRMHQMEEDTRSGSRLRREALIGASVSHQNLVPIYDIFTEEGGDQVIVMEYVEGETLRHAVRRDGRLEVHRALRILEGVAAALDAIHAQGIVHRDVKPANILLGKDGSVKLADLGVASAPDRTAITTTGGVVGTFSYMAPEQLGGERATSTADIYAFAAVAFEALSGRKARTEPNPLALAHGMASGPQPDLRDAWPDAPAAAAKLLKRGMSRNPKDRPKSAGELTARLRQALAPEATAAVAPPARKPAEEKRAPAAQPAVAVPSAGAPPAAARSERAAKPVAPARPAERADPAPADPDPRRRRLIFAAALIPVLVVAAAVAAIAASGGSSPHRTAGTSTSHVGTSTHAAGTPSRTRSTASSSATSSNPASSGSASTSNSTAPATSSAPPAAGSAAGSAGSPVSAVERFYTLAAGHDYGAAWALADPTFQRQLGGYRGFQSTMSASRSITFDSARTVSQSAGAATVAVQTTSTRTNGTQHCAGTVQLVPGSGGGWLLHQIGIVCR